MLILAFSYKCNNNNVLTAVISHREQQQQPMALLALADCETTLRNSPISSKDISEILDSLTAHLKDGTKDEVDKVAKLIEDIKEPISSLFKRVETLEKELEETKKELEETKKEAEEVKKKWEGLKTLEDSLLIGQLAFTLEKELIAKFLKGTTISPKHVTIQQIFIALRNENDYMLPLTPEQKDIINANLRELEREYQLDHSLYRTITALKHNRNIEAHPSIENISTRLSDKVSPSDKEAVDRMLAILQNLGGCNAN